MRIPSLSTVYPIFTYPDFVHFTALVKKFIQTCLSRLLSRNTQQSGREVSMKNFTSGFVTFGCTIVYTSLHIRARLNFSGLRSMIPDSIFDRSRMSLINRSSKSLLVSIIFQYSAFSAGSSQSTSNSENPIIEFSGVRISWLMLARKADLSRSESSARSFISFSSWAILSHFVLLYTMPV